MPRPGVDILTRESPPSTSIPTDTGVGFMGAVVESGPLALTETLAVHNMTEYEQIWAYTKRSYANSTLYYDSAETFFKEGGYKLYVGRVVGPAAVTAQVNLPDSGAATTLIAFAKGPGDYGNDLNVVIRTNAQDTNIPLNYFRVRVQTDAGVILEESPDLVDDAAAVLWSKTTSKYITFTDSASTLDPAAGTYALTGGTLDVAGINDAAWQAALDRFRADLGPGQVFCPGRTTGTGQVQIANHALAYGRIGLLDAPDTPTVGTLTSIPPTIIDSSGRRHRFSGLFAPWLRIAGVTVGSTRVIPPSPAVAGLLARNDSHDVSQNQPSAGDFGILSTVLSLTQEWIDADRTTLNAAGVNIIRDMYGLRKVYGFRTTADPISDVRWLNLSNSRLQRAVAAIANAVAERFVFRQLDGEGKVLAEFAAALTGEACMPFYDAGSLYGATAEEAFKVDVGPSINTDTTLANNELRAVIQLRMSPYGELVTVELVKLLTSEEIAA